MIWRPESDPENNEMVCREHRVEGKACGQLRKACEPRPGRSRSVVARVIRPDELSIGTRRSPEVLARGIVSRRYRAPHPFSDEGDRTVRTASVGIAPARPAHDVPSVVKVNVVNCAPSI